MNASCITYKDSVAFLLKDSEGAFEHIATKGVMFKRKLKKVIEEEKFSIATVRTFIGVVNAKLADKEPVDLRRTLLATASFLKIELGLNVYRYSENLTLQDIEDLKRIYVEF